MRKASQLLVLTLLLLFVASTSTFAAANLTPPIIETALSGAASGASVYVYITDNANKVIWQGWSTTNGQNTQVCNLSTASDGTQLTDVLDSNGNATVKVHFPQYCVYVCGDGTVKLFPSQVKNPTMSPLTVSQLQNAVNAYVPGGQYLSPYYCATVTIKSTQTLTYTMPYGS